MFGQTAIDLLMPPAEDDLGNLQDILLMGAGILLLVVLLKGGKKKRRKRVKG